VTFDAGVRFFSLLALVAGASAVLLAFAGYVPVGRRFASEVRDVAPWLAWLVAAVSTAGSLWFSESQHLEPCRLCWFQRIAMYPLAVILLVAAIRRDRDVRWYAGPLAGIGLLVSTYHYVIEWRPSLEAGSCDVDVPCTVPYFREFGFVSLAFMAMCGFAAILALLLLTGSRRSR